MSTSPSSSASPGIAPIAWAAHMTAALGVRHRPLDRVVSRRARLRADLQARRLGWAELRSPIAEVNVGIGQTEDLAPRGGATLTFGVADIEAARTRSRRTASGSTARRRRFPGWSGSRPSTTPTGTRSCWRRGSTCRRPAAGDGPRGEARVARASPVVRGGERSAVHELDHERRRARLHLLDNELSPGAPVDAGAARNGLHHGGGCVRALCERELARDLPGGQDHAAVARAGVRRLAQRGDRADERGLPDALAAGVKMPLDTSRSSPALGPSGPGRQA